MGNRYAIVVTLEACLVPICINSITPSKAMHSIGARDKKVRKN